MHALEILEINNFSMFKSIHGRKVLKVGFDKNKMNIRL